MSKCRSYREGNQVCRDGFPQKPYCRDGGACWSCGQIKPSSLPLRLGDEMPPHLITDAGYPRLAPTL